MAHTNLITVEVAYATPERQQIIRLQIKKYSTIQEVIAFSGILDAFPEIDWQHQRVGVFSKLKKLTDIVKEGDRIEIYRQLKIDPKEMRRKKAKNKRKIPGKS